MNKSIAKPLIILFTPPETNPIMKRSQKSFFVPVNTTWAAFRDNVLSLAESNDYDSILVHVKDDVNRDMKGVVGNMAIKINALSNAGTRANKPVLTYDTADKPFYLMNPSKNDLKEAGSYAPSDKTIMEKYQSFESDDKWQEHQDTVWKRMKDMMPLSKKADDWNRNHTAQLKNPKRGLDDKDLGKFWSFKSKQMIAPTVMGDDMIGMPSIDGREYEGFTMSNIQPDGTSAVKQITVRSLMTVGATGIMIPMANANGHVNKHQIASDLNAWSTVLHFRAADGITVEKKQLLNKQTKEYNFHFADGEPTHLKVTDVSADETITMKDSKGIFNIKPKKEIIDTLKERGYNIPEIIASVKAEQNGKYVWQSPGTMTGSDSVLKTVSPSNPGYIVARPPKNEANDYVVLVAEGALKGHIVAKYIDVQDKDGECFGDKIAGDRGIIVTQVPGVSEAYIKNALTIYDKYNIKGTYIAMDADGRENRNVALGIHNAYNYINERNPATVLSWDPAQKGMDDALLAVAQGKITIKDMGLVSGTPNTLFPLENARVMLPYTLEGTQRNQPMWQQEYKESKEIRETKIVEKQTETAVREEQKKQEWVQTPKDISNIQSVTIAKAAEMMDAMNGKIIDQTPEPRPEITPDVDELIGLVNNEEKSMADEEKSMAEKALDAAIKEKVTELAKQWDRENPPMTPVKTPGECLSVYKYKQPVIGRPEFTPYQLPENMDYQEEGEWGILTINEKHVMTPQEKGQHQDRLKDNGLTPVGNMRLVEQTLTRNKDVAMTKTIDTGMEQ